MELRGITVTLVEKTKTGEDALGAPIYTEAETEVGNVLVSPTSTDDAATAQNLTGKKAAYTLAIPKGDTHEWEDRDVIFFGRRWHTIGITLQGIEDLVPLSWHKKVMVEYYE